jgi:hypothetical protein
MARLGELPFEGELYGTTLRVQGEHLDAVLRDLAKKNGWVKEDGGPRWRHQDGGILPLL